MTGWDGEWEALGALLSLGCKLIPLPALLAQECDSDDTGFALGAISTAGPPPLSSGTAPLPGVLTSPSQVVR